jgi:hypothetical protein
VRRIATVHAGLLVGAFFITLLTLSYSWPVEVERRGTVVDELSVEFGLPLPSARAESGQPWLEVYEPIFISTFNPWENPFAFDVERFLLSWLIVAGSISLLLELSRRVLIAAGRRSRRKIRPS